MSVFHFLARTKEQRQNGSYEYIFYPDFVMAKEVFGVFELTPGEWQPRILVPAGAEEKGPVSTDKQCLSRLTHKMKVAFEEGGSMPEEISCIS